MKFTLTLDCDTPAFGDDTDSEVAYVLKNLALRVHEHGTSRKADDPYALIDSDGNVVGVARFEED